MRQFSGLIQICRLQHCCLFCTAKPDEPPVATIIFDIKFVISALNSSVILSMISCWFYCIYFDMCNNYCKKNQWKQNSSNQIVNLQALVMKYECFTCLLTYIVTMILYSWDTSIDFSLWHLVLHTNFNKSQPMFQGAPGNTGLTTGRNQSKYIFLHIGAKQGIVSLLRKWAHFWQLN